MKTTGRTAAFVGMLITALSLASQPPSISARPSLPLNHKLVVFDLKDGTLVEAIAQLSRQDVEGLHLGLEEILREKTSDALPDNPKFSLSLHNKTVRQVLDALCGYDARYTWIQDGETINIYPRTTAAESTYLLNRHMERLVVKEIPDPEEGLTFLDRQLPPPREQLGYAGTGGSSSYAALWTETFVNLTVRQYINRLSEHMGLHTSWVFYGSRQERLFMFAKGGFH